MIQANEVRVGNLLTSFLTKEKVVVDWLVIKHLRDGNCQAPPYDNDPVYEPLPLTPELLEACGFVRDRNGWHLPMTKFSLTEKYYPCWMDRMLWPQDVPDFKDHSLRHLHHLQNLYQSLTGTELEVNPSTLAARDIHPFMP